MRPYNILLKDNTANMLNFSLISRGQRCHYRWFVGPNLPEYIRRSVCGTGALDRKYRVPITNHILLKIRNYSDDNVGGGATPQREEVFDHEDLYIKASKTLSDEIDKLKLAVRNSKDGAGTETSSTDHLENLISMTDQRTWKSLRSGAASDHNSPAVNHLWFKRAEMFLDPIIEESMINYKVIPEFITHWGKQGAFMDVSFKKAGEVQKTGIWPLATINSPRVRITTKGNEKKYLTFLVLNFDRPNPSTGYYEEFCHWLVTNIVVDNCVVEFEPKLSSYICPEYREILSRLKHFQLEEPFVAVDQYTKLTPGEEVLPYLPFHPGLKNPKSGYRYIFAVYEQSSPNSNITIEELNRIYESDIQAVNKNYESILSTYPTLDEQICQEKKLLFPVRSACLPAAAFAEKFGLKLLTTRFLVSKYRPETSIVFDLLGIKEPAYISKNLIKDKSLLMSKVLNSVSTLHTIIKEAQEEGLPFSGNMPPLHFIPKRNLDALNSGSELTESVPRIPSQLGKTLKELQVINQINRIKKYNLSRLPYRKKPYEPKLSSIALAAIIKSRRLKRISSVIDPKTNSFKEPPLNPIEEKVPNIASYTKNDDLEFQHYILPKSKLSINRDVS